MRHNLLDLIGVGAIAFCLVVTVPALAQDFSSPPLNILPPPPPPPPPPKIEVPKIPEMGEISSPPSVSLPQRGSFSDRITRCIQEGAAAGLGPNERSAYSAACANQ
jgi:hypothetical protein